MTFKLIVQIILNVEDFGQSGHLDINHNTCPVSRKTHAYLFWQNAFSLSVMVTKVLTILAFMKSPVLSYLRLQENS